jgi:hypothetical protein
MYVYNKPDISADIALQINAELNAGGFPGWLETINSTAREPTPAYTVAYKEWLSAMDKYLLPAEIGNGGPIILTQIGMLIYKASILRTRNLNLS